MIEAGVPERDARSRFYLVDRGGLLVEGMAGLQPFQAPFAQSRDRLAAWKLTSPNRIGLAEVVTNAHPTVLIGTSGQAHSFSEGVVRAMAAHVQRPVIFPLSNPTERSEATPQDLLDWTDGRAVIGTGSPFPTIPRNGHSFRIDQTNNSYVPVSVSQPSPCRHAVYRMACFSLRRARSPNYPRQSAIRAPISCRRSGSCENCRSRSRSRSPSRQKPRDWRVPSPIRI
jgi:hypothetical protein